MSKFFLLNCLSIALILIGKIILKILINIKISRQCTILSDKCKPRERFNFLKVIKN